jgi:predicted nucleic acid-binding protein
MPAWFADTYYFLALRNPKDEGHAKAVAATSRLAPRQLVTTTCVLTEVADALAKPANRSGFAELMEMLAANPDVAIVPPTQSLFDQGVSFYNARPDKEWSLTDCISFVVMTQLSITEALTADHHFVQAGYKILLN